MGERIRVRRLGVWPGAEVRVSCTMFTDGPVPGPPPSFYASRTNRASKSVIAYTRTLPEAVVDRVRQVGDAVSARDWDRAEELTSYFVDFDSGFGFGLFLLALMLLVSCCFCRYFWQTPSSSKW